jgi:hypothetical protein
MVDIWRNDDNVVFDYATVAKPYLENFSLEEIATAFFDETVNALGELSVLRVFDSYSEDLETIFVNPRKEAFTFVWDELSDKPPFYQNLDLSIQENLEWVIIPVYMDEDSDEAIYPVRGGGEVFKVFWDDGELETIRITAKTDFYEKRGLWPHTRWEDESRNIVVPLMFIAELMVQGKKFYVFYQSDEESVGLPVGDYPLYDHLPEGQDAIIIAADGEFPEWVEMLPWEGEHLPTMLHFLTHYDDWVDETKEYVPQGVMYKTIDACQDTVSAQEPYTQPVVQFPVYSLRVAGNPIPANDSNSLTILTDGHGNFSSFYQQT